VAVTIRGDSKPNGRFQSLDQTPGVYVAGPMEEVALLYSAADLFISSSRAEGQPFAVLEALSSGVPVLASPLPGHEMVAERVPSCRVVDMDDPNALADGITSVLGQKPEERRSMVEEGCRAVAANFGLAAWASHLFELYGKFVG
jgi:glycosyltransferase involved in cell wall biosynthesis